MVESNPGERWAPIPEFEGWYEASDLGRIRSVDRSFVTRDGVLTRRRGKIRKPYTSNSGYLYVMLSVRGVHHTLFVHSMVLSAFRGSRPEGSEGCHNNGDQLDNRLGNLRWASHAENEQDKDRHGTRYQRNLTHCRYGHLLEAPNLVPSSADRGHRCCWACSRAHDYGRYCRQYGKPFDFQSEADEYYRRIMDGDTGSRHKACPQGHLLEHPNLMVALATKGKKGCLACNRARNNAADARRAGRPFDFQAVADRHYERIMAAAA